MKTIILLIALLGITTFSSCKKSPFDYRTKYIGKWEFIVYNHSYTPYDYTDTTYTSVGHIEYGIEKDEILVFLSIGKAPSSITINKDGTIDKHKYKGKFEGKTKISYSYHLASPASGTYQEVTGVKK